MNTKVVIGGPAVLHLIVGETKDALRSAENATQTSVSNRYFVLENQAEEVLKEAMEQSRFDMVVLTVTESDAFLDQALLLSKMAKERGILSLITASCRDSHVAEYMAKHDLNRESILHYADCLLFTAAEEELLLCLERFLGLTSDLVAERGFINLDFADVASVLKDSGIAYIGSYALKGLSCEKRLCKLAANEVVPKSMLATAKRSLIQMSGCESIGLEDVVGVVNQVQKQLHSEATVIFGAAFDDELQDELQVTVLVSDFDI